jgi:hypothetical protein
MWEVAIHLVFDESLPAIYRRINDLQRSQAL